MADEYGPYIDASTNEDTVWGFASGVIRFDSGTVDGNGGFITGGPYIHANSLHINVGITGLSIDEYGRLAITTDTASAGTIGSPRVEEDETLSARGIQGGISGGNGFLNVKFGKNGVPLDLTKQADWDAISGPTANIWVFVPFIRYRGVGQPSKTDQALAAIAALTERMASAETAIAELQQP